MSVPLPRLTAAFVACSALIALTGCPNAGGNPSPGDLTIASQDSDGPTISLGAGQSGGQNVTVNAPGGSAQSMKLVSKTGSLNLLASASDDQSGVQALEIWMNKKTTTCTAPTPCQVQGPGLLGKPAYDLTNPKKNPGETGWRSSTLAEALDLTKEIPQGQLSPGTTRTVEFTFFAKAKNNFDTETQTPELTVTWSE